MEEERLRAERAKGDYAHHAAYTVELARDAAIAAQIEAERMEAETAQWVEDRYQELRERQMAREVLGADADRAHTDALRRLAHEVLRTATRKK